MDTCLCGAEVWCKKWHECKRCYFRRYQNERRLGQSRKSPKETVDRSCTACGTVFNVVISSKQRYCSRRCSGALNGAVLWAALDPDQRSAFIRVRAQSRTERPRLCRCGHSMPYYSGHQLSKCDDCVGTVCKRDGCSATVPRNRKWCAECRAELRRLAPKDNLSVECSEPECSRPVRARGVCNMHYKALLRSEGRIKQQPWNDRRRNNHYVRKARMYGGDGESVRLSDVIQRDGSDCALCGAPVDFSLAWPDPFSQSLDHVIPLSKGGPHTLLNCQLAHLRCNISKGDRVA